MRTLVTFSAETYVSRIMSRGITCARRFSKNIFLYLTSAHIRPVEATYILQYVDLLHSCRNGHEMFSVIDR